MNAFVTAVIAGAAMLVAGVSAAGGAADPLPAANDASKLDTGMRPTPAKPGGTGITVRYRIEATPETGKPLQVTIGFSGVPDAGDAVAWFTLDDGLAWAASPPPQATLSAHAPSRVTLTVIPQGESRGYINVFTRQAGIDSSTAIPIAVGKGTQTLRRPGVLKPGPSGGEVISIPVP